MNNVIPRYFLEGFLLGIALFSAPGPKDTLVIRQGVGGGALRAIVAICIAADVVLITIGASAIGALLEEHPRVISALKLAGAAYLVWFGGHRCVACLKNRSMPDLLSENAQAHITRTAFLLSFANPYAWLDTVVLIGPMAVAKPMGQRLAFLIGTMVASGVWFALLAAGSRQLIGIFKDSNTWRLLDAGITLLMAYLVTRLLRESLRHIS